MRFDILTLFPELFTAFLNTSIPRRAFAKGLVDFHVTNIRDFSTDAHRSVDDKPFGGGSGMIMMCQTLFDAVETVERQGPDRTMRVLLSPQGRKFDQETAQLLASQARVLLIAARYEGYDERIVQGLEPLELSIGDYVLSGGELPAMVIMDAVIRLLPGALGAEDGAADESFAGGLLEYPQYTRPREYRGMAVPEVLMSGDHAAIARWKMEQRQVRTRQRRPDLWRAYLEKQSGC